MLTQQQQRLYKMLKKTHTRSSKMLKRFPFQKSFSFQTLAYITVEQWNRQNNALNLLSKLIIKTPKERFKLVLTFW